MHIVIIMRFNLESGKRVSKQAFCWDAQTGEEVTSELPQQLLLPRQLPQEWLPVSARTHAAGPLRSWIDLTLSSEDESGGPEGFPA